MFAHEREMTLINKAIGCNRRTYIFGSQIELHHSEWCLTLTTCSVVERFVCFLIKKIHIFSRTITKSFLRWAQTVARRSTVFWLWLNHKQKQDSFKNWFLLWFLVISLIFFKGIGRQLTAWFHIQSCSILKPIFHRYLNKQKSTGLQ